MRHWLKVIPPKMVQEKLQLYRGVWMPQMDRCWESDDGYSVMSRQIRTEWGVVEHLSIQRSESCGTFCGDGTYDIPWAVKQEIKNELVGDRRVAIEVFPTKKNLVDVCDVYHLWVLPKGFQLPFGIHPTRDPQGTPVERGYDFTQEDLLRYAALNEAEAWNRRAGEEEQDG